MTTNITDTIYKVTTSDDMLDAFRVWCSFDSTDVNDDGLWDRFSASYRGSYHDIPEFIRTKTQATYFNELAALPSVVTANIDWRRVAREMEDNDDIYTVAGPNDRLHFFEIKPESSIW